MHLKREHKSDIDSPAWQEVEYALESINPRGSGFVILSRPDGSYVQCAGARLRLIVEWRKVSDDGKFRHVVLGKDNGDIEAASINTTVGIIQLQRNEILSIKSASEIFRCFYDEAGMPESFVTRDVTENFHGT